MPGESGMETRSDRGRSTNALAYAAREMNRRCKYFPPTARLAIQIANLQPGETVLDLGAGGGAVLALAKVAVGGGLCIGVDCVPGFLEQDVPHRLHHVNLAVAPTGTTASANQVICPGQHPRRLSPQVHRSER
jgi:tRNA G10  N-methylase Trm11